LNGSTDEPLVSENTLGLGETWPKFSESEFSGAANSKVGVPAEDEGEEGGEEGGEEEGEGKEVGGVSVVDLLLVMLSELLLLVIITVLSFLCSSSVESPPISNLLLSSVVMTPPMLVLITGDLELSLLIMLIWLLLLSLPILSLLL
jgi:hypothetical protein